jgi:hypothetical protein
VYNTLNNPQFEGLKDLDRRWTHQVDIGHQYSSAIDDEVGIRWWEEPSYCREGIVIVKGEQNRSLRLLNSAVILLDGYKEETFLNTPGSFLSGTTLPVIFTSKRSKVVKGKMA